MIADVHGTLTRHVVTNFIHHLRGGQFPLTGITSAGINQGFVLSSRLCGASFIRFLPVRRVSPPDINQLLKT